MPGAYGCPSGDALLFPSVGAPVQCSPEGINSCPGGYSCLANVNTGNYQCCSSGSTTFNKKLKKRGRSSWTFRTHSLLIGHCPHGQVQVRRVVGGKIVKRCEHKCPPKQVAIRGVCRDLRHQQNDDSAQLAMIRNEITSGE